MAEVEENEVKFKCALIYNAYHPAFWPRADYVRWNTIRGVMSVAEKAECQKKCGVWKIRSVESEECGN